MAGKLQTIPSGFNHAIPAVSVMFILFTVLMYGGINLLQERRAGQLERIYLSPATFSSIIGGKWISRLLLGMLQIVVLFLAGIHPSPHFYTLSLHYGFSRLSRKIL